MSVAVVFPGQGSQFVGMGKDLPKDLFLDTDSCLGYPLSKVMFEGPEEELRLTQNTQPALLTHSIALWQILKDKTGLMPSYFAGHSLGEYTALVAAGGFEFNDAVTAVHNRGKFMQSAVPVGIGGMVAVLGAADSDIEAVCKEISKEGSVVEPANYNCPGQVVVAGNIDALERFSVAMKGKGAKRVLPLPVSAPFHCSLMLPAQKEMEEYLKKVNINNLHTPVINNVDVDAETEPDVIQSALIRQMSGAVRWTQGVEKLIDMGVDHFVEVGAGSVLTGLIKKINKDVILTNISTLEDVEKFQGR